MPRVPGDDLIAPGLLEKCAGPWKMTESVLDQARVSKKLREIYVPKPWTVAQQLARLHELMHVKVSPEDYHVVADRVVQRARRMGTGLELDQTIVVRVLKMLEENRVDWLLWDKKRIDMRGCREMLAWETMTYPDDGNVIEAVEYVLQLAWTVWGSQGIPAKKVSREVPKPRILDDDTKTFFEGCFRIVQAHDPKLVAAVVKACLLIYDDPTPRTRDKAALEIAQFFQTPPPAPPPPERTEEKEAQAAVEMVIKLEEGAKELDRKGGSENEPVNYGHYEIHDHTRGRRRPITRIRRHFTAMDHGTLLKFPHRYMLDKMVFGRRYTTDGSLMIDASGSMKWTTAQMEQLLHWMPNIWIASYSGISGSPAKPGVIGRICIHASKGRFNIYPGKEAINSGDNDIDFEALLLLARQPEPRFWLSDGIALGGKLTPNPVGMHQIDGHEFPTLPGYISTSARLWMEINKLMKRARIIRIHHAEEMIALAKGKRVTGFRTTYSAEPESREYFYQDLPLGPDPISYQL